MHGEWQSGVAAGGGGGGGGAMSLHALTALRSRLPSRTYSSPGAPEQASGSEQRHSGRAQSRASLSSVS